MAQITPRVNGSLLSQHIGRPVRIVGRVQSYNAEKTQMQLLASDNRVVVVNLAAQNQGVTYEDNAVIEVIGQAQGNAEPTLNEFTSIKFSDNFDLNNYDRLVQTINTPKFAALFM